MLTSFIQSNLQRLMGDPFVWGDYSEKDQAYCHRAFQDAKLEPNGSIYIGEVARDHSNMKWGKGIQIWESGSVYLGFWREGQFNGNGRLIHANGDV